MGATILLQDARKDGWYACDRKSEDFAFAKWIVQGGRVYYDAIWQ
jgi:hypothetical protein